MEPKSSDKHDDDITAFFDRMADERDGKPKFHSHTVNPFNSSEK